MLYAKTDEPGKGHGVSVSIRGTTKDMIEETIFLLATIHNHLKDDPEAQALFRVGVTMWAKDPKDFTTEFLRGGGAIVSNAPD